MPTMPPSAAADLPDGVEPGAVLRDEVVPGGGYPAVRDVQDRNPVTEAQGAAGKPPAVEPDRK